MDPSPRRFGEIRPTGVLGATAAVAVLTGLVTQVWLSERTQTLVLMLGVVVLIFAALLASLWRALKPGPESFGWKVFSLSLLIAFLIQGSRIPSFLGFPLPAVIRDSSIAFQVLGSCLQAGALLAWHLTPRTRFDRIRHGLDGLLFALAVFFILWGLVLGPAFLSDRFPMSERLVWLATFLIYDLLLGLAVYFGLPVPSRFRGPLGWLSGAFLLAGLHNFKWLLDVLSGNPVFHFPAGPLIFAIPLAYLGAALSPNSVGSTPQGAKQMPFIHLLPYLPVLGATTLGIWLLVKGSEAGHTPTLVWLAMSLIFVLLVRQYLALMDFSTLSQHLEARVADRTEALEKAQAMLLRTERMNSLATIGAGLAHDMNNILNAIRNRAELVIMDLDEGKPANRKDLVRVQEATDMAAAMSTRLMALGRQEQEALHRMDLCEELTEILPLLRTLLPRKLELRLDCDPGPVLFLGTRGMLEQILVNLMSNASDAMAKGGAITLRAREPLPEEAALGPLLEIEDTGSGIPEEMRAQIFQPFFTTKESGKGTGLGLASVKTLLEKAGGTIDFRSEPGKGTIFQIRMPKLP